jgi:hypothetical protein
MQCETCGQPVTKITGTRFCSRECWRASDLGNLRRDDPSPELIRSRASRIRGEWSEDQMLERLRHDERPIPATLQIVSTTSLFGRHDLGEEA